VSMGGHWYDQPWKDHGKMPEPLPPPLDDDAKRLSERLSRVSFGASDVRSGSLGANAEPTYQTYDVLEHTDAYRRSMSRQVRCLIISTSIRYY
jgi:hypothetical protein